MKQKQNKSFVPICILFIGWCLILEATVKNYNKELCCDSAGKQHKPVLFNMQKVGDFPSGAVVKNPPANAGDTGSSPGPGRSHMLWSN